MIFVTVGTHEQQFNRLIRQIDLLKKEKIIRDEVFIQIGYSTYRPEECAFEKIISFDAMKARMKEAALVITHGGTGSVLTALYSGQIPVVVPRQREFGEHIDNHQVDFCRMMAGNKRIVPVYRIDDLGDVVTRIPGLLTARKKDSRQLQEQQEKKANLFASALEKLCRDSLKSKGGRFLTS